MTDLSIVVPAYNEAGRIGPSLDRLVEWANNSGLRWELLVVDDGSTDDTVGVVRAHTIETSRVRVLSYPRNRGKGFAVGHGVANTTGERVLFTDADLSTPIEEYEKLASALDNGADVAIGSRAMPESQIESHQPFYREWMGRSFNRMVRLFGVKEFSDTQCGFKLFRGEVARRCFARRRIDGFAFDVELLHIALLLGYRVVEVPVRWRHFEESRVHILRHSSRMFVDLLRVRWLHRAE